MNDVLAAADILVTDYSSAVFEFALLRRPIVYFVPDLDEYTASRAFYRPFAEYAIGPVVRDGDALAETIRSAQVDDALHDRFLEEFCGALDGWSTERIARDIVGPERPAHRRRTWIHALHLHLVSAYAARLSIAAVSTAMLVLPRRRKITMLTREHNRIPLDFSLLSKAIAGQDPTVEVKVIARMVPPGIVAKLAYGGHLLVETYHVATSRVLMVDGYSVVASAAHHDDDLTIVQMWHALGALKKFGRSILGHAEGRDPRVARAMRMHENYDIVIASGEVCRGPYAEAFGVDQSKVMIAPLPRVDYLTDSGARGRQRARFFAQNPDLKGRPIALFAPTFRAHGTPPGIDPLELTRAMAAIGYATVTKLHPILPQPVNGDLHVAPGMSTQDLLLVADIFITDYSSAVFEAAVAGTPSYLLAPDLEGYVQSRDFYVDYESALGLPLARTIEELSESVRRGEATPAQMSVLRRRFVPETPGSSAVSALARIALAALPPSAASGTETRSTRG
jgi:CDP-glycerol glycerophosphotransferase (TagB/SpsB family)